MSLNESHLYRHDSESSPCGPVLTLIAPATGFCERLGRALHTYGTPAHELEQILVQVSEQLGDPGEFFVTPTAIFASFGPDRSFMVRGQPGEVDLGKLARLERVVAALLGGQIGVDEASRWVETITESPPRYGPLLTTACFALAPAAATRFFGGGWREIVAALLIGLCIGCLALIAQRFASIGRLFETLAAALAAFVATAAAAVLTPMSIEVTMLGGLIVLIPGLTLTVAMNELATRNLVAGTARLTGAFMTFLGIGFGVAFGSRIGAAIFPSVGESISHALPVWTELLALLIAPAAFTILFRAQLRDLGWIMLAGICAFGSARFGGAWLGPELGAFLGAFLVGTGSNLFARYFGRPACVTLVPGIMLLVPGSIGFRSMTSLLDNDVLAGMQTAFTMTLVAVALVTGLLLANVVMAPRKPS